MIRRTISYALAILPLSLSGGAQPPEKAPWEQRREARSEAAWEKQQEKTYARAVENAREVLPREMAQELWGVNDRQVTRRGDSLVLAVIALRQSDLPNWTGAASKTIGPSTDPRQMAWVNLDPQLSLFLGEEPVMDSASVAVSVRQMLGLPPDKAYAYIATFWVSPKHLFRPTPDPDPTIHHSTADYPEGVDPAHRQWMEDYRATAYDGPSPRAWTRLGYAYDWGQEYGHIGVNEFVVRPGSPIRIESLGSIWNWYSQQVNTGLAFPVRVIQ